MPDSNRVIGKSRRYRSSFRPLPYTARSTSRFETAARLNQPISHKAEASWLAKSFATFLLALMVGALYEFFTNDWFFIYALDTQGLNYLMPSEVERASGVNGYSVFFVDPSAVERALKRMPEIKSARVATGIPNVMLVQIEERVPEMIWLKGSEVYWVDGEGFAFKARVPRVDLPTVRDLSAGEVKVGKRVQLAALNAVRALLVAWSDAPKNFEWSPVSGLSTTDEHGWKILFGDASDMELKVAKLQAIVPSLVSQGIKIKLIDLGKGDPYYQ